MADEVDSIDLDSSTHTVQPVPLVPMSLPSTQFRSIEPSPSSIVSSSPQTQQDTSIRHQRKRKAAKQRERQRKQKVTEEEKLKIEGSGNNESGAEATVAMELEADVVVKAGDVAEEVAIENIDKVVEKVESGGDMPSFLAAISLETEERGDVMCGPPA